MSQPKNFYLIRKNSEIHTQPLQQSKTQRNIFHSIISDIDYFTTCPIEKQPPQSLEKKPKPKKILPFINLKQLRGNVSNNVDQQKKDDIQIYKINENSTQKYNDISKQYIQQQKSKKLKLKLLNSPKLKFTSSSPSRALPHKNKQKDKWNKKINKYLYQKSIKNQIVYNQDIHIRAGDQYFQQILRNRHEEEMKPQPYIYAIKNQLQLNNIEFLNYVKKIHPQIPIRNKMQLRGVNKTHLLIDSQLKLPYNTQKFRSNSTKLQTHTKIPSITSNQNQQSSQSNRL